MDVSVSGDKRKCNITIKVACHSFVSHARTEKCRSSRAGRDDKTAAPRNPNVRPETKGYINGARANQYCTTQYSTVKK